jgi:predicted DNA-binding transcriptional regulator YafY
MLTIVKNDLVRAIHTKHLVRFAYKGGGDRIVEPHDYGIKEGVESLLGYQVGGESKSGSARGWKQFNLAEIENLRVLDRQFPGSRADSAQHHRTWDTLFARVR